jgi:hypothetical protein
VRFGEDSMPDKLRPKEPPNERILLSRITAVQEVRHAVFVIWLANGQMWRVEGAQRAPVAAFFRAGYDARIEKGALGSYQMSTSATGSKNWVQVTRIR